MGNFMASSWIRMLGNKVFGLINLEGNKDSKLKILNNTFIVEDFTLKEGGNGISSGSSSGTILAGIGTVTEYKDFINNEFEIKAKGSVEGMAYINIFDQPGVASYNHIQVDYADVSKITIRNKGSQSTEGAELVKNQGHPEATYSNIDRTRNTQGKSGGPFPFEMYYHPAGTEFETNLPTAFFIDMIENNKFLPGVIIDIEAGAKTGK
ncbi:hypothetical protein [Aureibacter tunicatorum]|uniref:Uncharacterized protein n=1 Tax=Aureibacter tunicatorum TaxID=866807 RepID=A0AAE3XI79_9BACT|nr:hypothetical protein [Aureibacter tunicatorum]MDR6237272.1 hypothetical protein [Aureibacter tunicatorum]